MERTQQYIGTYLPRDVPETAGRAVPKKNSGWELHPHTKTFDVLLDKLPWGVQIIKLPWMKTSLFCKWR